MGIQGIFNFLAFLLPVRSALQVHDLILIQPNVCRCPLKRAYRNVRALVSADARVLTFMASQSELDLNSRKGQNLCKAFVGVLRVFKIFEYGDSKINEKFELFWQQQKERKVVVSILYDSFKAFWIEKNFINFWTQF